jgi:hypothetical protein
VAAPSRLYYNLSDIIEELTHMFDDYPTEEEHLDPVSDGFLPASVARSLGASAADFYLGASDRMDNNPFMAAVLTNGFTQKLVDISLQAVPSGASK